VKATTRRNHDPEPTRAPIAGRRGQAPSGTPLVDTRVRWRIGQAAVALAGIMTLVALLRPMTPAAPPILRLVVTLVLGVSVAGSALLASLKGRGQAAHLAFFAFLTLSVDALGQVLIPFGFPIWPLMTLLVSAVAIAESLPVALGVAGLASLLAVGAAAVSSFVDWKPALASALGYGALVFAVNRALVGEKRRLDTLREELARLKHGIGSLDEVDGPPATPTLLTQSLRQVSEDGRRARRLDRLAELDDELDRLVRVAHTALRAHSVLYFSVDRDRETASLRAASGPDSLVPNVSIPLGQDPFAFVLDRKQSFYVTDFKRLLFELPFYRATVKIGSLLAVPVRAGSAIVAILVIDRLEIQSITEDEWPLAEAFASLMAEAHQRTRASESREELGAEFKAVYEVSRTIAAIKDQVPLEMRLLEAARELAPIEGGAVVSIDPKRPCYRLDSTWGWPQEFEGREVGVTERTWAAWILRGDAEEPYLLDHLAGQGEHTPVLVLDEGAGRGESLLAVPLRASGHTLGALLLTGKRGAFDATANRVIGILANQAAATLLVIQAKEQATELAVRDGLTELYNRRELNELLLQAVGRAEREQGRFAVLLLDIDHFKKLNDTFGHPAGDEVLRRVGKVLGKPLLRPGDQAARYGGEEFAVILPSTDLAGAETTAERVRAAIEKASVVFEGARLSVTASVGVAVWGSDGNDGDSILSAADRALYAAKQAGRNRVVAASTLPPLASADPAAAPKP
jgi:diguanylate cyclase (GGDEF)-like protein